MNWLIAKQILQKTWFYIKNYWWAGALIALGFVLHKFFLFDKDVFKNLYEEKVKQNDKEQKILKESHKKERKELQRVEDEYKIVVESIEKVRSEEGAKIKKSEKKRIREIITMPEEDRVKALADEFGLEIVEIKDETN